MKMILIASFMMLCQVCFSQEFMGIKVDGTLSEVVQKFKEKGFKYVDKSGTVVQMEGLVNGTKMELYIVETPISKKVWKFTLYTPKQITWYSLKSDYEYYKKILTDKYGEPQSHYEYFKKPYYEGDGFEMSAVSLENCTYSSFWENVYIQITKYKQIRISYENEEYSNLLDSENKNINKNTF